MLPSQHSVGAVEGVVAEVALVHARTTFRNVLQVLRTAMTAHRNGDDEELHMD